jgi:CHAD domain-containing protein
VEVEAKYTVADAETLDRLTNTPALAGYEVDPGERRRDRDTFLDTADRRFLGAGYYLRRRETDGGVKITLKQLVSGAGGVLRREELEALVVADVPPAEWPRGELRERVESVAGGAPLEPFLFLEQERVARRVYEGEREVAELSLDDVTVAAGGRARRWFEVEVELRAEGRDDDLERLTAALAGEPGLTPETRAKFARALEMTEAAESAQGEGGSLLPADERALHETYAAGDDARARRAVALLALDEGLGTMAAAARAGLSTRRVRYWAARYRAEGAGIYGTAPAVEAPEAGAPAVAAAPADPPEADEKKKRPGIDASDTMLQAAVKTLAFHLDRMLEHEDGTRLGEDSEELHVMRVSTRRMRMALRVFDDYLGRAELRPVLKGLRRTGRVLGAVRDLDVFQEKTQDYLDTLAPEHAGDLDDLLAACRAERDKQREHLVAYLDSGRYRTFVETFRELVDGPLERVAAVQTGDPRPQRVAQVLPGVLYRDMGEVWAFEGRLGGLETPLPRFHALRKGCKGLRYTLEFFEDVLGEGARPLIKKVKNLQDHLGDLQDAVVTCGILRDFLTWGTWRHSGHDLPGPLEVIVAPGAARYMAARQEEMERLVLGFPEVWPTVGGSDFSRELATVIAEI